MKLASISVLPSPYPIVQSRISRVWQSEWQNELRIYPLLRCWIIEMCKSCHWSDISNPISNWYTIKYPFTFRDQWWPHNLCSDRIAVNKSQSNFPPSTEMYCQDIYSTVGKFVPKNHIWKWNPLNRTMVPGLQQRVRSDFWYQTTSARIYNFRQHKKWKMFEIMIFKYCVVWYSDYDEFRLWTQVNDERVKG
jgi:hypothetical protein